MKVLGSHNIQTTIQNLAWAEIANIVKGLDNKDSFLVARDDAIRLFRHYFLPSVGRISGYAVAHAVLAALGGYRHRKLYTELRNEGDGAPRSHEGQGLEEYADITEEATRILHDNGVKVLGFCWGTGDYTEEDWAYLRARGWCGVDAIGPHCYWANYGFTEWNALRFAQPGYWQHGDPPVIIGECGRDKVRDKPGGLYDGNGGWMLDGISGAQYVDELYEYDALLAELPYVLGATVFTAGPSSRWRFYSTEEITQQIIDRYGSAPTPPLEAPMEYRDRWTAQYARWKAGGGVSDVDFLGWMAVVHNHKLTRQEFDLIADAAKGNIEALKMLPSPP